MTSKTQILPSALGRFWLVITLLLVALPHLLRMPIWLTAGGLLLFAWRIQHERHGTPLPSKRVLILLTVLGILGVGVAFETLVGREAGVAFLTIMLCMKLFELQTLRDAHFALYIGYFLVVTNFLFTTEIFAGFYMLIIVTALTATLIALNHPHATAKRWRLYFGFGGKMLIQAIPMMIIMFLLFPRLSGPLWSMPQDENSGMTGLSDSMSIGNINQLAESDEVAFRVRFNSEIPSADKLYWRGPVLWQTDGRDWQPLRRRYLSRPSYDLHKYNQKGDPITYDVTMEPNGKQWIFALDLPAEVPNDISGLDVLVTQDFQLVTLQNVNERIRYSMSSYTQYKTEELEAWEFENGLQIPDANPRIQEVGEQFKQQGLSESEIVNQVLSIFRDQEFYYTRQPPLLDENPLDQFFFDSKRGFCEHYAATFTYIMRAAGIPSRVVTGYQGGELNEMGDFLVVRQSRAHAWSEVYLDDSGWTRIDPTAVIPDSRVETETDLARFNSTSSDFIAQGPLLNRLGKELQYIWDAIDYHWNLYFLGFNQDRQKELMRWLGLDKFGWQGMVTIMGVTIGLILLVVTLHSLWHRKKNLDPALNYYLKFLRKLQRKGIEINAAEGPNTLAERIIEQHPEWKHEVLDITNTYLQIRYGRRTKPKYLQLLKQRVNRFKA